MNIPFKHYKVGGCVRDFVLGKPVNDVDYVVVGATPEDMFALKFSQVGADFPVFLHPETKEEYALARTERKSGNGYNGFTCYAEPSVTLEEDLARRDFTMNAMAMDDNGLIIDPYNGLTDIQEGVLRHVSDAFAEDPLRVLRGARFAARYGFSIAPDTRKLMCHLIDTGELDHLTPERIIVEFQKGFETGKPSVMFKLLNDMNAMGHLFPKAPSFQESKLYALMDSPLSFDEKWAVFVYTSFKDLPTAELQERAREMKIPSASIAFATSLQKLKNVNFDELSASEKVDIWQKLDFRRRPDIAISVLKLKNLIEDSAVNVNYWIELNTALKSVVEQDIAKTCVNKADIQNKITEARIAMCDLTDRKFTNEDLRP